MNSKLLKLIFCALVITVLCGACESEEEETYTTENNTVEASMSEEEATSRMPDTIYVYISGEVKRPGVYEMKEGSRIYELIEMAGGLTNEAEASAVNQAALAKDQDMVVIPKLGETITNSSSAESGLININTASKEVLCTLPGIGESKAQSIISYRESNGSFKSIEDIQKIEGIKSGVYNKIKDSIRV